MRSRSIARRWDTALVSRLVTKYSTLDWSADGSLITKTRLPALDARRRFRNELRVNRLLSVRPPPVATPTLVDFDVQRRSLTFTAAVGEPLGPKYPEKLEAEIIDAVVEMAQRLRAFKVERRWFRRFDAARRIALARRCWLLTDRQADELLVIASAVHRRPRFGHGDLTARNVLRGPDRMVLIDWEWAGAYPDQYDLAFLWFSLVDVEKGRERVEQHLASDDRAFLLLALLIQLWHLQWYVPAAFRERHLSTRDQLIDRLCE